MTSHDSRKAALKAEDLLLSFLRENDGPQPVNQVLEKLAAEHPEAGIDRLRGAVWGLVNLGRLKLASNGTLQLLETALT